MYHISCFFDMTLTLLSSIIEDSDCLLWSKVPITGPKEQLKPNELYISVPKRTHANSSDISVSLSISMEHFAASKPHNASAPTTYRTYKIAWRVYQPTKPNNPWIPTVYFSTLPNGWIPENDLDLFKQFITCVKEDWLEQCKQIETYLYNRVSYNSRHKFHSFSIWLIMSSVLSN